MSTPEATASANDRCPECGDLSTHPLDDNCPTLIDWAEFYSDLDLGQPHDDSREEVAALQHAYGWQPMTALVHLARQKGHQLGTARLTESAGGRRGYMTRCTVPACGASVWEIADLQGGHGAGLVVTCPGSEAAAR